MSGRFLVSASPQMFWFPLASISRWHCSEKLAWRRNWERNSACNLKAAWILIKQESWWDFDASQESSTEWNILLKWVLNVFRVQSWFPVYVCVEQYKTLWSFLQQLYLTTTSALYSPHAPKSITNVHMYQ